MPSPAAPRFADCREDLPALPICRTMGFRLVEVGWGRAVAEGRLVHGEGKLFAQGSTTCLIFDL